MQVVFYPLISFVIKHKNTIIKASSLFLLSILPVYSFALTEAQTTQYLFTENKGQVADMEGNTRADVLFTAENNSSKIFLRKQGISYVFCKWPGVENEEEYNTEGSADALLGHRIDMDFENSNPNPEIVKINSAPYRFNFYHQHCPEGIINVESFNKVLLKNIYPGIDIAFYSNAGGFKYDFIIHPGANPNDIKLKYTGQEKLKIQNEELTINHSLGEMIETIPKVYQNINGKITDVIARYEMLDMGIERRREPSHISHLISQVIQFRIAKYELNSPLIIDPWVTFLGGSGNERGLGIDADAAGNTVTTGYTPSTPLPSSAGAFQASFGGVCDAYIAKFNSNGGLLFCTYYGGTAAERGTGVVFDASGDIYFCGASASTGMSTAGVVQTTKSTGSDLLIAKFSSAGVRVWGSYYGGTGADESTGIEVDGSSNIYITGFTSGGFPTSAGAHQTAAGGAGDAFIVKINSTGTTRLWSTYYGGSGEEKGTDIDLDVSGNVLVVGRTTSTNFSTTPGVAQTTNGGVAGTYDAFVLKFTAAGVRVWATYYGGTTREEGCGISSDATGNIIFSGQSFSANFPVSAGAYSTTKGPWYAGYITKLSPSGVMIWSTFYGNEPGSVGCEVYGVAVDKARDLVYISGGVYANGLPAWACAHQPNNANSSGFSSEDMFVARIRNSDGFPMCNTYLGGSGHDDGGSTSPPVYAPLMAFVGGNIALSNYDVHITAYGISTFPVTPGAYQTTFGGGTEDAIVAKICGFSCGENSLSPNFTASKVNICKNEPIDFTNQSFICDTNEVQWQWTFFGASVTNSTQKNPSGISYPNTGSYNVKLLITTPCGKDSLLLSNYINVSQPTAIINTVQNVTCFGYSNGGAGVGIIGGLSPYYYNWNTGSTSNSASGLPAGIYSVTVTDSIGCVSTTTVNITQPPVLNASAILSSSVLCNGQNQGSVISNVSGGTMPYTYVWNNSQNSSSISSLIAGVYSVTVTDTYGCLAISNNVPVNEPSVISLTVNSADALCNGSTTGGATASASGGAGGYNYSWSNTATGNPLSSLSAGIYTLTVTDANGCTASSTFNISEPSALSVLFNTSDAHCNQNDGSATAIVSGGIAGYNYLWNNGITNALNSNIPAGVYTITVTDGNLCVLTSSVTINNLNGVSASIAASTPALCPGSCDGTATAGQTGGAGPYSYNWNIGGTAMNISGLCAGTFSVVIRDANGCTDAASVTITQPSAIGATLTPSPVSCFGDNDGSVTVNTTVGGTAPYNYIWQNSSAGMSNSNLTAGVYSVTVTDANNCLGTFTSTVTEPGILTSTVTNGIICKGSSTNINVLASGATPAYSYSWNNGSNAQTIGTSPTITTVYTVTVTDSKGCTNVATSTVTVNELPTVDFSANITSGCSPLCITLTNNTPNTVSLLWDFGNGSPSSTSSPAATCYNTPGSYPVSITITDTNGCTNSVTKNNYITVHPDPIAAFSTNPNPTSVLDPTVYFTNTSSGATAWNWSFGDIVNSSSSLQNPTFTYADTGYYQVSLIVTNEFGCTATATDYVHIRPDYSFFIPNTFTPNNDGKNDMYNPFGIGWDVEQFEFFIFNRWGELIFKSNNPTVGWDGKKQNNPVQEDVYVWRINLKDINDKRHQYTGHVSLIR